MNMLTDHADMISNDPVQPPLWTLTYLSRQPETVDLYRLNWALAGTRSSDPILAVSSMLVQWEDWFVHVIEGPRDQVLAFFSGFVAGADEESNVILAHQGPVERRTIDPSVPVDVLVAEKPSAIGAVEDVVRSVLTVDPPAEKRSVADLLYDVVARAATPTLAA